MGPRNKLADDINEVDIIIAGGTVLCCTPRELHANHSLQVAQRDVSSLDELPRRILTSLFW
jgi:hypothetical protein